MMQQLVFIFEFMGSFNLYLTSSYEFKMLGYYIAVPGMTARQWRMAYLFLWLLTQRPPPQHAFPIGQKWAHATLFPWCFSWSCLTKWPNHCGFIFLHFWRTGIQEECDIRTLPPRSLCLTCREPHSYCVVSVSPVCVCPWCLL